MHFARAHACMILQDPDAFRMEDAARMAFKLSPKEPLAWVFWFQLGNAFFLRDFDLSNPATREAYENAGRYPNADYIAYMALGDADAGRLEDATHYLELAMRRYPSLSLAQWTAGFQFPVARKLSEAWEKALETLVELGLPRE